MMRYTELVLTALVSIAVTLTIVLATQPVGLPTGIVTIDASQAVLAFIKDGDRRHMEDAEYEVEARAFQAKLDAAIERVAAANNVLVVNSAAVLAGAEDITALVVEEAMAE
ncbi:conjugal transfer protein [Cereibacter changlensis]|jgi:conjugal transfer pilin signal peptidase TrbI|uniref:Conjugal transfer protein n=1 Tax=Cereibacter changlensis TaxID=402884 RepID=A0A4U0Z2A8_9RHOB|nr:TrbI F-type domain-containing protein [Cereibacter changlensis]TKA98395.1 conjugal transfer protein [Cereibacter changlensis]